MKNKEDVRDLADIQVDLANLVDDMRAIRRRLDVLVLQDDTFGVNLVAVIVHTIRTLQGVVNDLNHVKEIKETA
jgi:hypothetical protein